QGGCMITDTIPGAQPAPPDEPAPQHGAPPPGTSAPPAISLRDVHRSYGTVRAVDGVDLEIGAGEIVALLGPNGAGKSTTMELMVGLARAESGTVRIHGLDPATATRTGVISAMLQSGALLPDQ